MEYGRRAVGRPRGQEPENAGIVQKAVECARKIKVRMAKWGFRAGGAAAEHQKHTYTERRTMYILRLCIRQLTWLRYHCLQGTFATYAHAYEDFIYDTRDRDELGILCTSTGWPMRHPRGICILLHFVTNVIFLTFDFSTALS